MGVESPRRCPQRTRPPLAFAVLGASLWGGLWTTSSTPLSSHLQPKTLVSLDVVTMRSITLACARPPLLTPSIPLVVGRPRGQSSLSTRSPSSEAYLPVLGTPFHFFNPHPAPNSNPGPSRILPQPPTVTFAPTPSAQRSPHPQTPPPDPEDPNNPRPDQEVSDAEWEIRVARGMLHLRETLPHLFSDIGSDDLFPRDVFSPNVVLKLPVPFPVRIPGITGYRMAFAAGRSGLHGESTRQGRKGGVRRSVHGHSRLGREMPRTRAR